MITKQPENWIHGMSMELKEKRKMKKLDLNKIYKGNCLDVLKTFPDESVDMCITSPPYWGLRAYGTNPIIWDDDGLCEHEWGDDLLHPTRGNRGEAVESRHESAGIKQPLVTDSNLCSKCGAWRGELGLEPDFNLFIKHLCDIFDEVKRVLKPHGSCWVNLGDTYYTKSGGEFLNNTVVTDEYSKATGIQKANKVRDLGLLPSFHAKLASFFLVYFFVSITSLSAPTLLSIIFPTFIAFGNPVAYVQYIGVKSTLNPACSNRLTISL